MLTQFVLHRAGSLQEPCGASPAFPLVWHGSENNAQATRAESAQTVLSKTAQATRRLTASLHSVSLGRHDQ